MVFQRIYRSIPFQFCLVVSVLWTFHRLSPFLIEHYQISLQVNKITAPIFGGPAQDLNKWIFLPIIVFVIYIYLIRTNLKAELVIPAPIIQAITIGHYARGHMSVRIYMRVSIHLSWHMPTRRQDLDRYDNRPCHIYIDNNYIGCNYETPVYTQARLGPV